MNVKRGDKVKILTGKDRGKAGKIAQIFTRRQKVSVEGLNLVYKNLRPRKQGEAGQRIQFPAPFAISNVAVICPKCNQPTRIGRQAGGGKKKTRICRKCKATF